MSSADPLPTFRDPAGSLILEGDYAIRTIHPSARETTLAFLNSPLCHRLQARGDLIAATIDDTPTGLRLIHPRIPIPTYPWEWPPSQWQAAADLTLSLCKEALTENWILKDATPLNILFVGSKPILVDILTFERHNPQSSSWLAYGQYIRTFLLPLIMHELLGWSLGATILRREGYEPAELYTVLGWRQRLSRAAFWPITLPVLLDRSGAASESPFSSTNESDAAYAQKVLRKRLADLRRRTHFSVQFRRTSAWSKYPETRIHYTLEERDEKMGWVKDVFAELHPTRTLDVGANTGEYSVLAALDGSEVIALERDSASADQVFRLSQIQKLSICTICADLTNPTPAVGWENRECSSLIARLEEQCEMMMMLAVIHHFILIEQIPLTAIFKLCSRLTRRYLMIEWIPPSDPMYEDLMRGREDLYGSLSEFDLLIACKDLFRVLRRHALGNRRILFLLEKIP